MNARAEIDPHAELRAEAVRRAWEGAANNEDAKAALRAEMERDRDVYRAVMARHEAEAVSYLIAVARTSERRAIWSRPTGPDARVAHLAEANARCLYDLPLPSGLRLGDARAEDLREAAHVWRVRATDMAAKATFMDRVAERLDPGATVRESLKLHELDALRSA